MYFDSKRVIGRTVFVVFLFACPLSVAITVAAQGSSTGGVMADKSPGPASEAATPSGKARSKGKSVTSRRARHKAISSGHEKGPAVARTGVDSDNATAGPENPGASTNKTEAKSASSVARPRRTGRCDPNKEERTDLSGTYNGTVKYPDDGLDGQATLTINGNRFTLNSGAKTETGNITAVTTCSYTAVAMMFGEWKTPKPGEPVLPPLPTLSLRAVRKGDRLGLRPSPSEKKAFSFDSAQKK